MLSVGLLENDPTTYKFLLEKYAEYKSPEEVMELVNMGMPNNLTKKLNSTSEYSGWFSSHLHCLSYITGDMSDFAKFQKNKRVTEGSTATWYGYSTSIPEEEAIGIAKLMLSFGARTDIPNFYEETLLETVVQKDKITGRENNSNFIAYIRVHQDIQSMRDENLY